MITVKLKNSPYQTISATVFGASDYRLVEMNDYAIELLLQGDILLYQNMDKPGMLASVSRALADRQINIGALSLGRDVKGANAITAVSVDKKLDADDVAAISGLEGIHKVKYISF